MVPPPESECGTNSAPSLSHHDPTTTISPRVLGQLLPDSVPGSAPDRLRQWEFQVRRVSMPLHGGACARRCQQSESRRFPI